MLSNLSRYVNTENQKCEDDYEQLYQGESFSSRKLRQDSLLVTKNNETKTFSAFQLVKVTPICGRYAWSTTMNNVYVIFTQTEHSYVFQIPTSNYKLLL